MNDGVRVKIVQLELFFNFSKKNFFLLSNLITLCISMYASVTLLIT